MKFVYGLLIVISLFLVGCGGCGCNEKDKLETLRTTFHVTDINGGKHSYVYGYIIYNGIKVHGHSKSGRRKDYSLIKGSTIETDVTVYQKIYDNQTVLNISEIDVTQYETN